MDGDRLRLPANRNCYRLSRVTWALLKLLVQHTVQVRSNICHICQRTSKCPMWKM